MPEAWWFDFAAPGYGGYASLEFKRDLGVAWWSAAFVGGGWPLVAVRAHDVRIPGRGSDIRTDGLWASVTTRTVMMEAFGAVFDDPFEAWGDERGEIVPFGFDLEWDDGAVSGEVLLGDQRIEVEARGATQAVGGERRVRDAVVHFLSPVKPATIHALVEEGGEWRWFSWDG